MRMKYSGMNNLIVVTSPPASGKTYWILSYAALMAPKEILVVSPLRALANECRAKFPEHVKVMTPEEWVTKKSFFEVVIFDEFHLWFYWGNTFRPLMWEVFYELAQSELVVLLTATMNAEIESGVREMSCHFDQILWRDFGNQKLKYVPGTYLKVPSKAWMREWIFLTPIGRETSLIFCSYRQEVRDLGKELEDMGFRVWTCVGGEANSLSIKVQTELAPDFIVCTSVLSHGVNLPRLAKVYLAHEISNIDFWIQMVARGGRRGETFSVFALERPHGIKWSALFNFLAIQCLSLKMEILLFWRQVQSWFLKESSFPECRTKSAT